MNDLIAGQVFSRLTVLNKLDNKYFLCQCSCGKSKRIRKDHLLGGKTQSCGCLAKEKASKRAHKMSKANTKHGMSGTKIHSVWYAMRQRCSNPNSTHYGHYGGRGITVCERWLDFSNFLFDMGEPPEGMTLDRIDNNGNYEPDNCRWVSRKVQQNNRRANHHITHDGITRTLSQWAQSLGMSTSTLDARLSKGWSVERALNEPVGVSTGINKGVKILEHDGKSMTTKEWAAHLGIGFATIYARLKNGWPLERALSPVKRTNQWK